MTATDTKPKPTPQATAVESRMRIGNLVLWAMHGDRWQERKEKERKA